MDCGQARHLIGREVDGELAGGLSAGLSSHLKSCRACSSEMEAVERLRAVIASAPSEEPPSGLAETIIEAAKFQRQSSIKPPLSPLAVFGRIAAALLIAAAGLYLGARFQSGYSPVAASPAKVSNNGSGSQEAEEFQLVPPDSPGAQCLALLEGRLR